MNITQPYERLKSLWGTIDAQHNELIRQRVRGKRVLDVGCGYGSLVAYLSSHGFEVDGWDHDPESIRVANRMFPSIKVEHRDLEHEANVSPARYDTIIFKDSMHHVMGEGDVHRALEATRTLLKPNGRVVVLDPNPMWILRTARRIIGHIDPEAPRDAVTAVLAEHGFAVGDVDFFETIGLPVSGGYVGPRLAPNFSVVNKLVAWTNKLASTTAVRLGIGPHVCWRYILHADRIERS